MLPYDWLWVAVFFEGYCVWLFPCQVYDCGLSISVYVCECVLFVVAFSGPLSYVW